MEKNSGPLSPHIQIYKWQFSSLLSITHRLTGVINTAGFFLIVIVLLIFKFNFLVVFFMMMFLYCTTKIDSRKQSKNIGLKKGNQ